MMVIKLFGAGESRKNQIDPALRKFFNGVSIAAGTGCMSGCKKISRQPEKKKPKPWQTADNTPESF
ncbi:MAG: hypothetical protein ACOY4I_07140 [Bacillota bacterium]